jgi:hypothetical protein
MLRASPSSDRCDLSSTVSETRSDFPALCRIAQSELNHPATDSVAVCVPAVARRADSAWQVALLRQQCCSALLRQQCCSALHESMYMAAQLQLQSCYGLPTECQA